MSLLTATRIAELVGEMEAPECGHSLHATDPGPHGDGPATHYVKGQCGGCHTHSMVYPACAKWITYISADKRFQCADCGNFGHMSDFFKILGPVNK